MVREDLTHRFGGVTAYVRSPAMGVWEDDEGGVCRDDVVLFEVMADALDQDWWTTYRQALETRFSQETVLIRVMTVDVL